MTETIKRTMTDYLAQIADWRRRKAEEFDRDPRNLRTARALEDLAAFVLGLPDDDARLIALDRLAMDGERFAPGQMTAYELGRFRFFSEEPSFDAFLTHLVELAGADRGEQGRFGGRQVPGDDPWQT
jgi:hypothetical protein